MRILHTKIENSFYLYTWILDVIVCTLHVHSMTEGGARGPRASVRFINAFHAPKLHKCIFLSSAWNFKMYYYMLQSSLQIQRCLVKWWGVACTSFDTWSHTLRGVLSKLLTLRISIIHRDRMQIHNSICIISGLWKQYLFFITLRFNAHDIICIHSKTCGRFVIIKPLDKQAGRHQITCTRRPVEFADLIATCNKTDDSITRVTIVII